jgi:hypothetical protein
MKINETTVFASEVGVYPREESVPIASEVIIFDAPGPKL